jgi:hypothetical protein
VPWKSKAEARWGHSPSGLEALGGEEAVKEWDDATDFSHLPKKKKKGHARTALGRVAMGER